MPPRSDYIQPDFFHLNHRTEPSSQLDVSRSFHSQENRFTKLSRPDPPDSEDTNSEDPDSDDTELRGDEELLAEPLLENEFLENKFIEEPHDSEEAPPHGSFDRDSDQGELLDEASLNTVLAILAVLTTVEELAMLESLSTPQKQQVWSKTPEAVKVKLKQLRDASPTSAVSAGDRTSVDLARNDSNQLPLRIGDWVVLAANPKLTKTELVAIWEVVEVHEDYARIKTQHLGLRNYPIDWIMRYPKPVST